MWIAGNSILRRGFGGGIGRRDGGFEGTMF